MTEASDAPDAAHPLRGQPKLSVGLIDGRLTRPMIDGRVGVDGVSLTATAVEPAELFLRQLRDAEFDASEMSLSSLFIKSSRGDGTWWALPVFTTRSFFHTMVLVRRGAGIRTPADLRGKRVGVPEYQQTAAVWARGVLAHDYNVQPEQIEWYMERLPSRSHAAGTGSAFPSGVTVHHIPAETSIMRMLVDGSLDATLLYFGPTALDRSHMDAAAAAAVVPLFDDPVAEGRRFYSQRSFVPINHGMIVRRSLVEQHPWLPQNLYSGMLAAKQQADRDARTFLTPYFDAGLLPDSLKDVVDHELTPYGIAANRDALRTIAQYVWEQGLSERLIEIEDVFAPDLLDT